jgi:CheY-like chemotaxis protein
VRPRIIIVEDDEQILSLLSEYFQAKGYEIVACSEPLTCPAYVGGRCDCPEGFVCGDVLITDNRMPRMSGIDFIKNQIRAGCKGITQNKAILSGSFTPGEVEHASALGCACFEKPFSLPELGRWVEEAMRNVDSNRKLRDLTGAT